MHGASPRSEIRKSTRADLRAGHSAITRHARHTPEDEALDVSDCALGDGARVAGGDHQEQESRQGIHVVVSIEERARSFILIHL